MKTVLKLGCCGVGFAACAIYFTLQPTKNDNLATVYAIGAGLISISLLSLTGWWATLLITRIRHPRNLTPEFNAGDLEWTVVKVSRPARSASDLLRKYQVELDHNWIGSLRFGDYISVEVAPGSHTIVARQLQTGAGDSGLDSSLEFLINSGEEKKINIIATNGGARLRKSIGWLKLIEIDEDSPKDSP
jgi:hypothetical protein